MDDCERLKSFQTLRIQLFWSCFTFYNHPNHYIRNVWRLSRHSNLSLKPHSILHQWSSIWYESGLEIQSLSFDWFLIENWSNLIWIQPGSLKLIIWLILNWKLINFQLRINWIMSFRAPDWTRINVDEFSIKNRLNNEL